MTKLLTPERLAELREGIAYSCKYSRGVHEEDAADLLDHADAQAAEIAQLQAQVARLERVVEAARDEAMTVAVRLLAAKELLRVHNVLRDDNGVVTSLLNWAKLVTDAHTRKGEIGPFIKQADEQLWYARTDPPASDAQPAADETQAEPCAVCGGRGDLQEPRTVSALAALIKAAHDDPDGHAPCPECNGTGRGAG